MVLGASVTSGWTTYLYVSGTIWDVSRPVRVSALFMDSAVSRSGDAAVWRETLRRALPMLPWPPPIGDLSLEAVQVAGFAILRPLLPLTPSSQLEELCARALAELRASGDPTLAGFVSAVDASRWPSPLDLVRAADWLDEHRPDLFDGLRLHHQNIRRATAALLRRIGVIYGDDALAVAADSLLGDPLRWPGIRDLQRPRRDFWLQLSGHVIGGVVRIAARRGADSFRLSHVLRDVRYEEPPVPPPVPRPPGTWSSPTESCSQRSPAPTCARFSAWRAPGRWRLRRRGAGPGALRRSVACGPGTCSPTRTVSPTRRGTR